MQSCSETSIYKEALLQKAFKGSDQQILMAELGHHLFFDHELSINNSKSCSSCHFPELYFTDGYRKTLGSYADVQMRNTPTLINASEQISFNWANPSIQSIEQQMRTPLFSKVHFEMGMDSLNREKAIHVLSKYKKFNSLYSSYKNQEWACIVDCIALYVKLLNSKNSKFDRYRAQSVSFSPSELRGLALFTSDSLNCRICHGGSNFNIPSGYLNRFQNIGLAQGIGKDQDLGLYLESGNKEDIGKFRIPTLRNVAMTAPYMHDGSKSNLSDIIAHYEKPRLEHNSLLKGFQLNDEDKKCLIDFLLTLTDTSVLHNSLFKKPEFDD
jgi:cytochrome c peroxidase